MAYLHMTQRDRKSGSAGMPRPISYAVFCLKKTKARPSRASSPWPVLAWVVRGRRALPDGARTRRGRRVPVGAGAGRAVQLGYLLFFNDPATTEIYTLSLHAALPICAAPPARDGPVGGSSCVARSLLAAAA